LLYREFMDELTELIGLRMEDTELSLVCKDEVIVPDREDNNELALLFIESNVSARSKTLPLNIAPNDALCGVEGTVACTAGPRAAL
jgi:hypothetical protein